MTFGTQLSRLWLPTGSANLTLGTQSVTVVGGPSAVTGVRTIARCASQTVQAGCRTVLLQQFFFGKKVAGKQPNIKRSDAVSRNFRMLIKMLLLSAQFSMDMFAPRN